MVVFDSMNLIRLLDPDAEPPKDPSSGKLVTEFRRRLEHYVQELSEESRRVVVPAPALAELLVGAGQAAGDYIRILNTTAAFEIAPFDQKAAIEAMMIERQARSEGDKRGGVDSPWQKVKYDRQIVAIARAIQADTICSDDEDLGKHAKAMAIQVVQCSDLPMPPEDMQITLFGEVKDDTSDDDEADDDEADD